MRFEEYTQRLSLGNTRVSSSKHVQIRRVLTLPHFGDCRLNVSSLNLAAIVAPSKTDLTSET